MKTTILSLFKYFSVAMIGFFAPIDYAFYFTFFLVLTDTVTGVIKARKDDVKNITSKKAFPLVPKTIFDCLMIIVAHCCNLWVDKQVPFVKLVLIGIGWIEIKSIDENYQVLTGHSFIERAMDGIKKINQIKRN